MNESTHPASPVAPASDAVAVRTPDGLTLAARVRPAEGGAHGHLADVLFIHGFSQSGLCWDRQMEAPALCAARRATYDFRGHGASDKPCDPAAYQEPARWADELAAVMAAAGLQRPVLVGWSYAGRIIGDYLSVYGADSVSGLVLVDAAVRNERAFYGTSNRLMRLMCSTDLATNIASTRSFLRACFHTPPDAETFETLLAANMVVPPQVRAALFGRPADYDTLLAGLTCPVLVIHGAKDAVVAPAMAHHIAGTIPAARLLLLEDVGHVPFLEAAEIFNAALAAFLAEVAQGGGARVTVA